MQNILTGILLKYLDESFERLRKIDYNTIEGRKFGGLLLYDDGDTRIILDNNDGSFKNLKDEFMLILGGKFNKGELQTFGVSTAKDVINIISYGIK